MKVKLQDIIDAIYMADQYSELFLDQETGKIEYVSDMSMSRKEQETVYDLLDEHGFYRLPTSLDIPDYDIMEEFVDTLSDPAQDELSAAMRGRGAFRRFKDTVKSLEIAQQWYDYQEDAYIRKAVEWCRENGIEYED